MKKAMLCLCIAVFSIPVKAQNPTGSNSKASGKEVGKNIKNSPYLSDDWVTGTITTSKGEIIDAVKMRFDNYKGDIEYKKEDSLYSLKGNDVTEFSFLTGSDLYTFQKGFPAVGKSTGESFYRVLYDGNLKVLKRYTSNPKDNGKSSFVLDETLYVLKDQTMIPVKVNDRKGIMKVVADKKNHMEYAAKEQQLDFSQEADIIKLIEEYDAYKAGGTE
jgi:hypothetical protein